MAFFRECDIVDHGVSASFEVFPVALSGLLLADTAVFEIIALLLRH